MRRLTPVLIFLAFTGTSGPGKADTVTDWDAKAVAAASAVAPLGQREVALVDLAMFEAVNALEHRYQPYLATPSVAAPASADVAAASAAAAMLAALHPEDGTRFKSELAECLQRLHADSRNLDNARRLGEEVVAKLLAARADDGATAGDGYRPKTRPGQYVPTATVVLSAWPRMRPFALASAAQFRPGPPPALTSHGWADDYNEIKRLGAKASAVRTAQQTETARFWLMTGPKAYHPLAYQVVNARHWRLIDSAHFMAVYAVALTDAYIAVLDAKYHYEFWRPVTAIRNGDIDSNPDTEVDPVWEPLDVTPMHPEYPCAHCIESGAAQATIEALAGPETLPPLSLTSPTAPGVTHRWSDLDALTAEVADARVWAGFHFRTSTRVGTAMGRQVGRYVASHIMQPTENRQARRNRPSWLLAGHMVAAQPGAVSGELGQLEGRPIKSVCDHLHTPLTTIGLPFDHVAADGLFTTDLDEFEVGVRNCRGLYASIAPAAR